MSILIFGAIYLLAIYAFYRQWMTDAPLHDDDGNPVVVQLSQYRRRYPALQRKDRL